jgi:hypothetical protein
MYPGASFYGLKKIFLSYAGLPTFLPLPVAVQHGWQIHATAFEASASPPEIWVWSERTALELEEFYPPKKIRVVGSFFCYLRILLNKEFPLVNRRGSICIPPHSSHFASVDYSVEDFACALNELGDEVKPVTVMLYYLDVDERVVAAYEKFGFKVVSNGSLFSDEFLNKFIFNVADKKSCIFSDFGSGVLFASDLGLNLIRICVESRVVNRGNEYIKDGVIDDVNLFCDNLMGKIICDEVDFELGASNLLSPREIRRLIFKNYFTFNFVATSFRKIVTVFLRGVGLKNKVVPLR